MKKKVINVPARATIAWLVAGFLSIAGAAAGQGRPPGDSYRVPGEEARALPLLFVKTNLLQGAGLLAPNLGVEVGLGRRASLEFSGGYSLAGRGRALEERSLYHLIARAEFRYWPCERFLGHFFGVHPLYGQYEASGHEIPPLFEKGFRYEGDAWGGAFSYGYHWIVGRRWSVEFAASAGVVLLGYDKTDRETGDIYPDLKKLYFGPTNASVTLVFMIK
jgi:hypothetical protein